MAAISSWSPQQGRDPSENTSAAATAPFWREPLTCLMPFLKTHLCLCPTWNQTGAEQGHIRPTRSHPEPIRTIQNHPEPLTQQENPPPEGRNPPSSVVVLSEPPAAIGGVFRGSAHSCGVDVLVNVSSIVRVQVGPCMWKHT